MICGIDEAGKGSVLGPMVVGGVMGDSAEEMGGHEFADSKTLSSRRREELYEDIVSRYKTAVVVLDATKIDECRKVHTMNEIVAMCHAKTVEKLMPPENSRIYLDACDVNEIRYGIEVGEYLCDLSEILSSQIRAGKTEIISEHKADMKFPVVSAASIVAKVTRDRLIEKLAEEYGEIGSGYPSDPVTMGFLERCLRSEGKTPAIARRSWKTVSNIEAKLKQRTLFDY
ncbi:MAG: ribonuclease HII [Methanomicrobium sp.]|nr:ribonuclease HII [Methanomicrobium sp.]